MTSSFHGESGRAEGLGVVVWKWEREEQEYSSVWETQAWVCGWNVNEHGTGCEKWGCFAQWLQMCPFIMAPLLPFYSASVVVFFFFYVDLTSLMPSEPSHPWASQMHRCVCSAIDELPQSVRTTWLVKHADANMTGVRVWLSRRRAPYGTFWLWKVAV